MISLKGGIILNIAWRCEGSPAFNRSFVDHGGPNDDMSLGPLVFANRLAQCATRYYATATATGGKGPIGSISSGGCN